jgi:short-subunit dehydrogenase
MKPEFQNQVFLITGSSQGIGKSLAIHLGIRGAKIGLNGRTLDKLSKTFNELKEENIDCLMVPGDVTNYQVCEEIVSRIIKEYGKLDCVVANGSVMSEASVMQIKPEVFKTVIDSQILGAVYPVKAALQSLIDSKGYILMISSLSAFYGLPRFSSYSMGKIAHKNFAQSLEFEMANTGVNIGVAYVCFTKNETFKQMILPDGKLSLLPKRPGRMQHTREEVAKDLARMISKRKRKYTLSFYGKTYGFFARVFPFVIKIILKRKLPI